MLFKEVKEDPFQYLTSREPACVCINAIHITRRKPASSQALLKQVKIMANYFETNASFLLLSLLYVLAAWTTGGQWGQSLPK